MDDLRPIDHHMQNFMQFMYKKGEIYPNNVNEIEGGLTATVKFLVVTYEK